MGILDSCLPTFTVPPRFAQVQPTDRIITANEDTDLVLSPRQFRSARPLARRRIDQHRLGWLAWNVTPKPRRSLARTDY
jgi:hypothetical protein